MFHVSGKKINECVSHPLKLFNNGNNYLIGIFKKDFKDWSLSSWVKIGHCSQNCILETGKTVKSWGIEKKK